MRSFVSHLMEHSSDGLWVRARAVPFFNLRYCYVMTSCIKVKSVLGNTQ
jgi:hypothetical protein